MVPSCGNTSYNIPVMDVISLLHNTSNASKYSKTKTTKTLKTDFFTFGDTLPESDSSGQGVVAMHDRIESANELIHTGDLLQVLL